MGSHISEDIDLGTFSTNQIQFWLCEQKSNTGARIN